MNAHTLTPDEANAVRRAQAACTTWGYSLDCPCGWSGWSYTWDGAAWQFADHVRFNHAWQLDGPATPTPKPYKLVRMEDQ